MHRRLNSVHIQIDASMLICMALLLLVLPLQWLVAAVIAAIWHEFCHYISVRLCGGSVTSLTVTGSGIRMDTDSLPPVRALICSFAGPAGGFALLLVAKWMPRTAICGVIHSLYNLMPVYPLDGGRSLQILLLLLLPTQTAMRCWQIWERVSKLLVTAAACFCTVVLKWGILPLFAAVSLFMKTKTEKSLAN